MDVHVQNQPSRIQTSSTSSGPKWAAFPITRLLRSSALSFSDPWRGCGSPLAGWCREHRPRGVGQYAARLFCFGAPLDVAHLPTGEHPCGNRLATFRYSSFMARILLVEDEVTFRSVLTAALTRQGHAVIEAGDGRTGLALFKTHGADLVITDVMMPNRDGLEVIMEIRSGKIPTPILAMMGHPGEADIYLKVAKSLGAQRILAKPFRMEELLGAIDELVPGGTQPQ